MAFTPLTASQPIGYAIGRSQYRNGPRESAWGTPVLFVPTNWPVGIYGGYGGPKYKEGYTYYNSPETVKGNCTWWCWARLYEATGTYLNTYGDAKNWYDRYQADGGSVSRNATNIRAGDIIVLTDSNAGHVMFVERVVGDTITISQSAYSYRSVWNNMACLVTTFSKSEIFQGNLINMYKNLDSAAWEEVVGVMHTGGDSPTPPEPGEVTPKVTVYPEAYRRIMYADEDYEDFDFSIHVTGIPDGYTASGNNTYPGLSRVRNTGWSYTTYTGEDGNTYQEARKTQTLRYNRESNNAYTTTKYMYFNFSYPNGSASSTTPMTIDVRRKVVGQKPYFKKKRKRFTIKFI